MQDRPYVIYQDVKTKYTLAIFFLLVIALVGAGFLVSVDKIIRGHGVIALTSPLEFVYSEYTGVIDSMGVDEPGHVSGVDGFIHIDNNLISTDAGFIYPNVKEGDAVEEGDLLFTFMPEGVYLKFTGEVSMKFDDVIQKGRLKLYFKSGAKEIPLWINDYRVTKGIVGNQQILKIVAKVPSPSHDLATILPYNHPVSVNYEIASGKEPYIVGLLRYLMGDI